MPSLKFEVTQMPFQSVQISKFSWVHAPRPPRLNYYTTELPLETAVYIPHNQS